MNRRIPRMSKVSVMNGPLRMAGFLLVGVAWLSACDVSYPTSDWNNAEVDHVALSGGFDLVGVHETAPCAACHDPGNYAVKFHPASSQDCLACHETQYEAQHASMGYPTDCTLCHTPTDWANGSFSHQALSGGFDLWGPHTLLACTRCHVPGTFQPRFQPANSHDCVSCHKYL